ncbi:MAG: hypothetical protein CSB47_09410 [Proteobacteria bacterium]|nr:MAG: hypothetical protein CSB47_09410 [Pseudomonadota bacterium]
MANQIKTILATSALLIAASQSANAGSVSEVEIKDVGYAGNGCPSGSASVVLAPDKKSVSVLFDEYIAEAGGRGQRTFDRKKCDIAFGLKIPSGISVSFVDADYRGFNDLPRGARASFKRDYFFAGSRGPSLTKSWRGARSGDFHIKDKLSVFADVWSACGADVILRSKTAATVRSRRGSEALMMVDSADLTTKTVYRYNFRYRTCR